MELLFPQRFLQWWRPFYLQIRLFCNTVLPQCRAWNRNDRKRRHASELTANSLYDIVSCFFTWYTENHMTFTIRPALGWKDSKPLNSTVDKVTEFEVGPRLSDQRKIAFSSVILTQSWYPSLGLCRVWPLGFAFNHCSSMKWNCVI